jgi:phosphotransferase system enzyme I (PtsI)
MAGQPRAFAVLLGMGLRRFSMSPAFVPYVKECARHLSTTMAQDILQHVSRLQTTNRIARHLAERLAEVFPEFDQFDVGSGHGRHDRGAASRPRRA